MRAERRWRATATAVLTLSVAAAPESWKFITSNGVVKNGGLPYALANFRQRCAAIVIIELAIPIERLEWRRYIANLQGA